MALYNLHSAFYIVVIPPELRYNLSSLPGGGVEVPGEADLNGVAFALVRLQDTYNLTVDDLVMGNIRGQKAVNVLSGECGRVWSQAMLHDQSSHEETQNVMSS